jgi:hypothetical protein
MKKNHLHLISSLLQLDVVLQQEFTRTKQALFFEKLDSSEPSCPIQFLIFLLLLNFLDHPQAPTFTLQSYPSFVSSQQTFSCNLQ